MLCVLLEKPAIKVTVCQSDKIKKQLSQVDRSSELRDENLMKAIRSIQKARDGRINLPFRKKIFVDIGPRLVKYIYLGPIPIKRN